MRGQYLAMKCQDLIHQQAHLASPMLGEHLIECDRNLTNFCDILLIKKINSIAFIIAGTGEEFLMRRKSMENKAW
jgi:hypothetical protein